MAPRKKPSAWSKTCVKIASDFYLQRCHRCCRDIFVCLPQENADLLQYGCCFGKGFCFFCVCLKSFVSNAFMQVLAFFPVCVFLPLILKKRLVRCSISCRSFQFQLIAVAWRTVEAVSDGIVQLNPAKISELSSNAYQKSSQLEKVLQADLMRIQEDMEHGLFSGIPVPWESVLGLIKASIKKWLDMHNFPWFQCLIIDLKAGIIFFRCEELTDVSLQVAPHLQDQAGTGLQWTPQVSPILLQNERLEAENARQTERRRFRTWKSWFLGSNRELWGSLFLALTGSLVNGTFWSSQTTGAQGSDPLHPAWPSVSWHDQSHDTTVSV